MSFKFIEFLIETAILQGSPDEGVTFHTQGAKEQK